MSTTPVNIHVVRTGANTAAVKQPQVSSARAPGDIVQWFLDYYWIRHPISDAHIAAYRNDLLELERWLTVFRSSTLLAATMQDVRAFLEDSYRSPTRQVRDMPCLSCIKRFYFYLVEVGLRADDPTERVFIRRPCLVEKGN